MININLTLLWAVINFFVLVYLLHLVLYKPVTKLLAEREASIKARLEDAERREAEAEELKRKYQEQLEANREEAKEVLRRATQQGETMKREIIAKAQEEAERLRAKGKQEISLERERAWSELREQVVSVALAAAGKVIGQTTSEERERRLVEDFLAKLTPEAVGEKK